MTATGKHDPRLYGKGGVADGLDPRAPLRVTEKPHPHRSIAEVECYDCGNTISKGEQVIVSAVECTQGVKGRTHRYQVHLACYDVVGRVILVLGKDATHSFDGRPSLRDLWAEHHEQIGKRDKSLHELLTKGFGKP